MADRRPVTAVVGALLVLLALLVLPVHPARAAAAPCTQQYVGGAVACVGEGQPCAPSANDDLARFGLECATVDGVSKMVKASGKALRGDQPFVVSPKGTLALSTALKAFDAKVHDLPGVKRPAKGEIGSLESVRPVILSLLANRKKLSKKQLKVVRSVIAPIGERPAKLKYKKTKKARAAAGRSLNQLGAIVAEAKTRLEAKGLRFNHPITVALSDVKGGGAFTLSGWVQTPKIPQCRISFETDAPSSSLALLHRIIAHEVIHCAQDDASTTLAEVLAVPLWVSEGSALWGGDQIAAEWDGSSPVGGLGPWFEHPERPIEQRVYDAAGFWALQEQEGSDLWQRLPKIWADATGGANAAWDAATAGAPESLWQHWGTTLLQRADFGPAWNLDAPDAGAFPPSITTVANGSATGEFISGHGGYRGALGVTADVLRVGIPDGGTGLMRDSTGTERPAADGDFCAKSGGCVCPDGTDLGLPKIGAGLVNIGISQRALNGVITFTGVSLDELCKDHQKPQPPPQPPVNLEGTPLEVRRASSGTDGELLASFTYAQCVTEDKKLTVTSTSGQWKLTLVIDNVDGGDQVDDDTTFWDVQTGGVNHIVIDGPEGTHSDSYWPGDQDSGPDPPGVFVGGIAKYKSRPELVRAGASILFGAARTPETAYQVLGGVVCAPPPTSGA